MKIVMKLSRQNAAKTILDEIIRRLVQRRIELGLTQQDVVDQTGVSLGTIKRMELGGDCRVSTLIHLLQTYDLIDRLDMLVPEPSAVSPIQFVDQQQKPRRRASKTVKSTKAKQPWKWEDEK